jgi:hypothetical protein
MFRIFSLVITVASICLMLILILGYREPISYEGSISFETQYRLNLVWQQLLNLEEIPNRKSDVKSVDVLEEYGKLVAWKENLQGGGYRIYRITESSYGLTGIWSFDLKPEGDLTWVTISEKSTLTDIRRRGYRAIIGRDIDLSIWQKYLRVGLLDALLITP